MWSCRRKAGPAPKNQIATLGSNVPTYDASGNLLTINTGTLHTYTWDAENRVASIDGKALTYDALDRVVEEGPTLQILYGPTGKLGVQSGQTNTRTYLALPKGAGIIYDGSSVVYQHPDLMGNGILGTDNTKAKIFDRFFAPFGEEYNNSGATVANFTGNTQDLDANLYDYTYREQSPVQGRWLNPDPSGMANVSFGDPQTLNRYAYVRGSAMGLTDVNGLGAGSGVSTGLWAYLMSFIVNAPMGDNVGWERADKASEDQLGAAIDVAQKAQKAQNQSSFWSRLGHGLSNLFHGHSWNYIKATVTAEDVGPHEVIREPNPYVAIGTDALGIVGTRYPIVGYLGSAISVRNDPSATNVAITGAAFVPVVGEAVGAVAVVQDVATPVAQGFVDHVMTPMFNAAPPQNIEDGNGHLIPNPAFQEQNICQDLGCH